jgi:hypothetical protein
MASKTSPPHEDASSAPFSTPAAIAFQTEWSRAAKTVRTEAIGIVQSLGCSEALIAYLGSMNIYPRIPYLTASWIADQELREQLGMAISLHAIGLKLLDDLVDADSDLPVSDLGTGHVLTCAATSRFHEATGGKLLVGNLAAWMPVYRHVIHEPLTHVEDLQHWVDGARLKSLLYLYVEALYRERRPEACDDLREAFELFAALGQVVDDYKDREGMCEPGNLILMIADGRVSPSEALAWVEGARQRIRAIFARFTPDFGCADFFEELGGRACAVIAAA